MNLLPLLLGFALLGSFNKQDKKQAFDLSQILSNPDVANLLPHMAKLLDKNACDEDKNFAIMNLLTNPAIFEIMQKFVTKPTQEQPQQEEEKTHANEQKNTQNQEEKTNQTDKENTANQQSFSAESQEFFAPIQEVADKQISKKLYALYDNWYVKK